MVRVGSAAEPRLLFTSRDIQPVPRAGAPIRTHRLLSGLASRFPVTVLTFEHADGSTHGHVPAAALREEFPAVDVVTVPGVGSHKRIAQALSVGRSRSHEWGRYRTRRFVDALADIAGREAPAVVHHDDPGVAQCGPVPGALNALAPHNVEHRILRDTADARRGGKAAFARLEARKVAREEAALWRGVELCVAVSALDADTMRAGGARDVVVAPNGTDAVDPLPPAVRREDEPFRLLFVGTGSYWPNEHGVAWFVDEVLPLLRGDLEVELHVVGRPPSRPRHAPEVTYAGRVPDLTPYYASAHGVIVPLHLGSGTRLKVVEAMACRRLVISTTLGAEGLPVRPGSEFLGADDPAAFAAAVVDAARMLGPAGDGAAPLLDRARAASEQLFWPRISAALADEYAARLPPAR